MSRLRRNRGYRRTSLSPIRSMPLRTLGRVTPIPDNHLVSKTGLGLRGELSLIGVLLAVVLATSCGGLGAKSNNVSSSGGVTLSATSIDFGGVAVGNSKTSSLTVTNPAGAGSSVSVSQVTISGAGYTVTSAPMAPFTLAAGQSATVSVTFAPKSSGTSNGTATIALAASNASVGVTGDGLAPGEISVSPTAMDFGNVQVGSSKNKTGTLNAGAADITVSSADWTGQGYSLSGITFPVTVPSGKSVSFTVTFDPQAGGTADGQVSFLSNATNSPTVETFSGNGTQSSQHSVELSWNASPSNVVGYYVYRSTQSGTYSSPLNTSPETSLTFTDTTVESGTTYFYVVTSVDDHSQQSSFSNEASAVIP